MADVKPRIKLDKKTSEEGRPRRGQGPRLARHGNRAAQGQRRQHHPAQDPEQVHLHGERQGSVLRRLRAGGLRQSVHSVQVPGAGIRPRRADLDRRRRHARSSAKTASRSPDRSRGVIRRGCSARRMSRVPSPRDGSSIRRGVAAMISRRDFLQLAAATAALAAGRLDARPRAAAADPGRAAALRCRRQCHAGSCRRHPRPARAGAVPRAVGQPRRRRGQGTGAACHRPGIARSLQDPAGLGRGLCAELATTSPRWPRAYGRLGGLDRIATILKAIRAERGDRVVFLDGGDTWQNSYTSLQSKGQDMVDCMALLQAGRHGRPLGVHARRRARQGDRRQARLSVPGAEHPRHRMERGRRSSRWP